ncbi:acetaldehyde dehydrogenase (acetylating) [Pantoea sp. 18069]|uniref:acetaldehyde dehydrogenase (acetylating) n=1 Tax=Pantoea sp. 18069 TaxID=2681415 RepID=UPI001357E57F|nr:acetaldehyde dehydrogenase (acetylating) [Pantoea sp. 18069]
MTRKLKAAIIGSGNIGTDLMIKILRHGQHIEIAAMVGIDPASDGLARAARMGVATTHEGVEGLAGLPQFADIDFVFDATSAGAHVKNDAFLRSLKPGIRMIDLTPAAIGPYCIPVVNGNAHLDALNVNMVTCGGQATIPMVAAVSRVAKVHYGEIIASISSKSAGPGTRANIDEFTETTSKAIEAVGGATKGKAIIIMNPAEPPLLMRDTVYTLSELADETAIADSVARMAAEVHAYVPGYRLKQRVQFDRIDQPIRIPGVGDALRGLKTSIFLEVEGAAHYLPAYAGNLDIMTSAGLRTAEQMAARLLAASLAEQIVTA